MSFLSKPRAHEHVDTLLNSQPSHYFLACFVNFCHFQNFLWVIPKERFTSDVLDICGKGRQEKEQTEVLAFMEELNLRVSMYVHVRDHFV